MEEGRGRQRGERGGGRVGGEQGGGVRGEGHLSFSLQFEAHPSDRHLLLLELLWSHSVHFILYRNKIQPYIRGRGGDDEGRGRQHRRRGGGTQVSLD